MIAIYFSCILFIVIYRVTNKPTEFRTVYFRVISTKRLLCTSKKMSANQNLNWRWSIKCRIRQINISV